MIIKTACILKTSPSMSPVPQSRSKREPKYDPGDKIVWDQRTLRLLYERPSGERNILAVVYQVKDRTNAWRDLELPSPASYEQARALVYALVAGMRRALEETDQSGLTVWIIR